MVLTGAELARAYLAKARLRMEVLELLAARQGWSDLVRVAAQFPAAEVVQLVRDARQMEAGDHHHACRGLVALMPCLWKGAPELLRSAIGS